MAVGFNWFLILIMVVTGILVAVSTVYILVEYQHPEDKNQAWVPKIVVLIGLTVAIWTVLLFPLDVANTTACSVNVSPSSCNYTLPMETIWYVIFFINLGLVFVVIPFSLFFYETDSDYTWFQKLKTALIWTLLMFGFAAICISIMYLLIGYVEYPVQNLTSGMANMTYLSNLTEGYLGSSNCIKPIVVNQTYAQLTDDLCDEFGPAYTMSTWKLRVSLPVYVMALQSVAGWLLFLIFAGVGLFAAPIDWIQQWWGRPRSVITRSEYMRRARILAQRAKICLDLTEKLRRQEKNREWRNHFNRLSREVANLEEDEFQLERVYPQGEDGDSKWILFVIGFWLLLLLGVLGLCLSIIWVMQMVLYMLPPIPFSPFLNSLFTYFDKVFSLLGVIFFSLFCLYLMTVAMKGNFMLGMNLGVVSLYPMRPGATMMSSFLVNTAIILTMSPAIVQFCAQAFPVYSDGSAIFDVFGNQVLYLQGIKYIYSLNIFLYAMLAISAITIIYMLFRGKVIWKKRNPADAYLV